MEDFSGLSLNLPLTSCVENIHAAILKKRETSKLRKAFRAVSDKAEIETLKASLRDFLLEFQVGLRRCYSEPSAHNGVVVRLKSELSVLWM